MHQPAGGGAESEAARLLVRSVTFARDVLAAPAPRAPQGLPPQPDENVVKRVANRVWGSKQAPNNRVSESLDYEPVQNKIFYDRMKAREKKKKAVWGYTGHTLAKFLVTFVTGVLTGCFAVAMSKSVGLLIESKNYFVQEQLDNEAAVSVVIAFLWWWMMGSVMVAIATAMVQYWAPSSAGAGVTLVMAYLNGNHIPNLLRFSTLITKFVGTVCAVSAGLPMGPEGPMVHIGACTASCVAYFDFKWLTNSKVSRMFRSKEANIREKLKVLDEIVSDGDHREFVSAGVSAGISAAFGAPIGGVLFSMEEACSFWSRKTAWRCFIAATLSTYTIQVLNKSAVHGMIAFSNLRTMENSDWGMQLPFLLINFAMAGLLGAAFNSLRMWLWKVRAAKTLHLQRIAEVIGLVFLVGLTGFLFSSLAGKCLPMPLDWYEENDPTKEPEYGFRFRCEEGEYNDLATLFLSSTHHTIIRLFSMGHDDLVHHEEDYTPNFSIGTLALYTTVYLVLMSIGAGLAIPGGLFMPSIVVGASWGGMWGLCIRKWLPGWNVQPGLYALLAATGVLGGVFRSAISLVVLMVEGTRGIDYLFGIILAVVVANWVAHHIHHDGVYESELERIGNVYMLRDEPPHRLLTLTAESIMATGVVGFRSIETVERIMQVLRNTTHNGFPVFAREGEVKPVRMPKSGHPPPGHGHHNGTTHQPIPEEDEEDDEGSEDGMPLVLTDLERGGEADTALLAGLILRSQLLVLLQRRHFVDASGWPVGRDHNHSYEIELETEMRTFFRRYYTHSRYVSAQDGPLDALGLDGPGCTVDTTQLFIDMRPYMNRSPFTIRKDCSGGRAHQAFVSLGLRHLLVVDSHNVVVGIMTRKDLDHAAGHGWWRLSHQAEPPQNKLTKLLASSTGFLKGLVHSSSAGNLGGGNGASGSGHH